jgi:replicative DNA helicase
MQVNLELEAAIASEAANIFYNPAIERGILIALYQEPALMSQVIGKVNPGDFFAEPCREIFAAMQTLAARGAKVDRLGLLEVLGMGAKRAVWDEWGIIEATVRVDPAGFPGRLEEFRRLCGLRALHRLCRSIQKGVKPDERLESVAGRVQTAMLNLLGRYGPAAETVDLNAAADRVLNPARRAGLSCPAFPRFSEALGLFNPGDLTMIAARTKVGKSLMMLRIACGFAGARVPVLIVDTEMSSDVLATRALAMLSGISPRHFLDPENREAMARAKEEFSDLVPHLTYIPAAGWGTAEICNAIREFRRRLGLASGIVLFDWFRVPGGSLARGVPEWQALKEQAQAIKAAAAECQLPVVAAAQQTRGAIGVNFDGLVDGVEAFMAGADAITHFASCSCAIYRVPKDLETAMGADDRWSGRPLPVTHVLAIGGNRNGGGGAVIPLALGADVVFREVEDEAVLRFISEFRSSPAASVSSPRQRRKLLRRAPPVPVS